MANQRSNKLDIQQCLDHIQDEIFQLRPKTYSEKYPKWPGSVGIEVEMLPIFPKTNDQKPALVPLHGTHSLTKLLEQEALKHKWQTSQEQLSSEQTLLTLIKLNQGDNLSFEPGGQLEFSSIPYPCLSDAVRRLNEVQKYLDTSLASEGWQLSQVGLNPWLSIENIPLQMNKARYQAMDQYFSAIGPYGRRMMRQTCTIQVCVDFGPDEQTLVKRYLTSILLAPFATAIFANSPFADGKEAGCLGFRSKVWQNIDPSRTGFPDISKIFAKPKKETCARTYLDFLLNAQVIYVNALDYMVPQAPVTFAHWLEHGINGVFPDYNDFLTHVSLHFPEVRPRGFLELRSVDCQARPWQIVPAAFYSGILYDDESMEQAFSLLSPFQNKLKALQHASMDGLEQAQIHDMSIKLMGIAMQGFSKLPPCFQGEGSEKTLNKFSDHFTMRGRTPANDLLDRYRSQKNQELSLHLYKEQNQQWCNIIES